MRGRESPSLAFGAIRPRRAEPVARRLLRDKTPTSYVSRDGMPTAVGYDVQVAAALALVRLIGSEAVPIIEEERSGANWHMKQVLAGVLEKARQTR